MAKKTRFTLTSDTRVNVKGLDFHAKELVKFDQSTQDCILREAADEWGDIYRTFLYRRYLGLRSGGTGWRGLSDSTLRWRRSKGIYSTLIFNVTNTLARAIRPNNQGEAGRYQRRTRGGISVGIGGPGVHRMANMKVSRLATIHARGSLILPPRDLVALPNRRTQLQMSKKMGQSLREIINRANKMVRVQE